LRDGAGEREEFSVSLAWHARRQLSFIIARELSLIWQSLSRPSSLLLGTIVMPTRSIYIYDVIALINRNNEAICGPKQHHANIWWHQRSAQTAVASGLHGTTTKTENFFWNVIPYRTTQLLPMFQRIWLLRNVGSYTSYNTMSHLGRPNITGVSLKNRNLPTTCKTRNFVLGKAKGWTGRGSKPGRRRISHPQTCPDRLWYPLWYPLSH